MTTASARQSFQRHRHHDGRRLVRQQRRGIPQHLDHDGREQREAGTTRKALRKRGIERRNAVGGHDEVERRGNAGERGETGKGARRIERHDLHQRRADRVADARVGHGGRKPQNARHIDAGAHVDAACELIAGNKPDARQKRDDRRRKARPRRADAVPALGDPQRQHHQQQPAEAFFRAAHRRRGGQLARRLRLAGKEPADKRNQHRALEQSQHWRVQQQIGQIVKVNAERAFRRAAHHQIGHVGGQNSGGELERAEAHRQRQAVPAAGVFFDTGAFRHRRHDGHQQRDAPHVRRHDERQRIAEQHHARHHLPPGIGQPRRQRPRCPVRKPRFTDGHAQHETAEHQPERR
ncbi:Parallel beta-helix repeat protein [Cronobacter universalis NCTC 9529]|nr:Parallel beta-helix repeat protein [Cronobacter universalis NCTC 9529]